MRTFSGHVQGEESLNDRKSLFERKSSAMILAASTAVVWAFAFPLIKLGINEFSISGEDTGAKTLFAGVRFFLAGIIVLIISIFGRSKLFSAKKSGSAQAASDREILINGKKGFALILLLGLVNTSLHYFFYYIGLSNQSGSRSAIIDSASSFILILAACAVFAEEHLTMRKIIGCALGFGGILLVNAGGDLSAKFTLMGDGMLVLSAVFSALGGLLTRVVTVKNNSVIATGISLGFGGLLLMVGGIAMGGRLNAPTPFGIFILLCLTGISVYGFSVYNKLISCNSVGEIAIFNSLIPILGVTFSCIILKEPFRVQYILAGIFTALGIFTVNYKGEEKNSEKNNTAL